MRFRLIFKEKIENIHAKDTDYWKVRDHCHYTDEYRGAGNSIRNLNYTLPKGIPIAPRNGSNYDYHLIMKELAERFEGQFTI